MSSTETTDTAALTRFHRKWILPLSTGGTVRLDGHEPSGPDTFFIRRARTRMEPDDFRLGLENEKAIAAALRRAWAGTPLQPMAKPFVKLTRRFENYEQSAEISSNVYEMEVHM